MPQPAPSPLARALLPLLLLALAGGAVALLWLTRAETDARAPEETAWPVRLVAVSPGPKQPVVRLYGRVESPSEATVSAAVQADVVAVPVREGARVKAGELLVRLDETDLKLLRRQRQAQVEELQAQLAMERRQRAADRSALDTERSLLALAERELARVRRLASNGSASQSQVDAAEQQLRQRQLSVTQRQLAVDSYQQRIEQLRARLEQARAALSQAERDVARTTVNAPFPARVAAVEVAPGSRVAPGAPLVRLYDTSALQVRAPVPSVHLAKVREALEQDLPLSAVGNLDSRSLPLRVSRLAGEATSGQAGGEAIFDVLADPAHVPLGQFVVIELHLPAEPGVVAVPYEAIYGNDRIYRAVGGRMHAVDVERVGDTVDTQGRRAALVRSENLADGDRIVATQIPRAANGLRVREARPEG